MVVGMWQVSGAHGYQVDARKAVSAMRDHYRSGLYCFDMADHYGPAEDLYGIFQTGLQADGGELGGQKPLGFTKWVPPPGEMSRRVVQENVDISLQRMKTDKLDMMQFHWWDYGDKRYIDALKHMTDMKAEGIINALSLTNFNADYLEYIVDQNQIPIATNQVSYSLIDRRPENFMVPLCEKHNIQLITYGTLLGGFLSERYLDKPEPRFWGGPSTASQGKYKQFIDRWGGWARFQNLLKVCQKVASKHNVTIPNVALRYILQKPAVGSVLVGTRLGLKDSLGENLKVFDFELTDQDMALLDEASSKGGLKGDCGDEYRGIRV